MAKTAAIEQNFSVHIEMSWMGGRAGKGGWPGVCAGTSSIEISNISTNSSSKIRLTTFGGRVAAGWYGPGWERLACASPAAGGRDSVVAVVPAAGGTLEAAAASSCRGVRPVCPGAVGVKVGSVGRVGPGRGNI